MEFVFKKTTGLSEDEREQIRSLFLRVFEKEIPPELFERRFLYSCKGYSYHGLMLHEKAIVGSFTAIPYRYKYFGKELVFGLSVDTMIAPEHRGGKSNLVKMAGLVYQGLVDDGIPFIYGFPNELYYNHEKRIHNTKDIGKLDYYILPVNIGAVISKAKLLNPLSRLCAKAVMGLPGVRRAAGCGYYIEKVDNGQFRKHRYDDTYSFIDLGGGAECVYKIYEEQKQVSTVYIIDVMPLTPVCFDEAVRRVYRLTSGDIDLIIYVGKLPFRPRRLIKIPGAMEPQKIRMTGKILMPEVVDESVFEIENWNVNISNFDVR